MAIPKYYEITLPLLRLVSDGAEHGAKPLVELLAKHFCLTNAEFAEKLRNGGTKFQNLVAWAKVALKLGKLIETSPQGSDRITDRGKQVLAENPNMVDHSFLMQFQEYAEAKSLTRKKANKNTGKLSKGAGA
jgi:restriction system protein